MPHGLQEEIVDRTRAKQDHLPVLALDQQQAGGGTTGCLAQGGEDALHQR
jgi:hypothetical protein